MSKSAKRVEGRRAASTGQLWLRLPGLVRDALYETVIGAGLAFVDEVLEAERVALYGELYAHLVDREASRAGHDNEAATQFKQRSGHHPQVGPTDFSHIGGHFSAALGGICGALAPGRHARSPLAT